MGSPDPENLFVGACETPTHPWKSIYRGGSGDYPPLQNDFQAHLPRPWKSIYRAGLGITRPYKTIFKGRRPPHPPLQNYFQGRLTCPPLQIVIFSYEKQGRLHRPPLKISFCLPLQTLSTVVKCLVKSFSNSQDKYKCNEHKNLFYRSSDSPRTPTCEF